MTAEPKRPIRSEEGPVSSAVTPYETARDAAAEVSLIASIFQVVASYGIYSGAGTDAAIVDWLADKLVNASTDLEEILFRMNRKSAA